MTELESWKTGNRFRLYLAWIKMWLCTLLSVIFYRLYSLYLHERKLWRTKIWLLFLIHAIQTIIFDILWVNKCGKHRHERTKRINQIRFLGAGLKPVWNVSSRSTRGFGNIFKTSVVDIYIALQIWQKCWRSKQITPIYCTWLFYYYIYLSFQKTTQQGQFLILDDVFLLFSSRRGK